MALTNDELQALRTSQFSLDCVRMTLSNTSGESPISYSGAGSVRQDSDGTLRFVRYDPDFRKEIKPGVYHSFGPFTPGVPIPQDELFRLEATDWRGRHWISGQNIVPDTAHTFGSRGLIARGELFEISHESETQTGSDHLWLHIPGELKIPTNKATSTIRVALGRKTPSFRRDIWHIEDEKLELILVQTDHGVEVNVNPKGNPLKTGLDTRIEEALWLVLAPPVVWDLLRSQVGGTNSVAVRSRKFFGRPRVQPPLQTFHELAAVHLGRLLLLYLDYLREYEKPRYHPMSVNVAAVLAASASTIEAEALVSSVAVESIVNRDFADYGKPNPETLAAADKALSLIQECEWEGSEKIRPRVEGLFGLITGTNARNALAKLTADHVIMASRADAWNRLRQIAAHGYEFPEPLEAYRLCR